ncbi:unnamed protein product [Meloidogyne enterolobii]|uniref:Uncharacterized protein n=1 Tax=Meloidogyne enterolobii TaxID=390850 RepID=A0ACB0Z679_MELEN
MSNFSLLFHPQNTHLPTFTVFFCSSCLTFFFPLFVPSSPYTQNSKKPKLCAAITRPKVNLKENDITSQVRGPLSNGTKKYKICSDSKR